MKNKWARPADRIYCGNYMRTFPFIHQYCVSDKVSKKQIGDQYVR